MIVIFRHGETMANKEKRLTGWMTNHLDEQGKNQVKATAKDFSKYIDSEICHTSLYCSSLTRSIESAKIFEKHCKIDTLTKSDSLREIYYGEYDGLHDFDTRVKEALRERENNYLNYRWKGGESMGEVYERVSRFLDVNDLRNDYYGVLTVFHVHENVSKVLRGIYMRLHWSIWSEFAHNPSHYYIINNIHCREVQC